jgi:hypothetical protein
MQKGCGKNATCKLKEFAFHPLGWRLGRTKTLCFHLLSSENEDYCTTELVADHGF